MEFWVAVEGESYGPYEPDQLQQMVTGGQLAPDAEIWFPDRNEWVPAEYLVGFVPAPQLATVGAPAGAALVSMGAPTGSAYEAVPNDGAAAATPDRWAQPAPADATAAYPVTLDDAAAATAAPAARNPWAIGALVAGVVALGLSWLADFSLVSRVAALVGILLGVLALLWVRKGAGGKTMAIGAMALSALAAVVTVAMPMLFPTAVEDVATDVATAVAEQPADTVVVTVGPPRSNGAATVARARVTNTSTVPVTGGTFTVQAIARNGTVVDQTSGSVPALQPGEMAPVQLAFAKLIPPGASLSVSDISAVS